MRIDQQRLVAEFSSLVAIDSPSFGEKQMGEYLKKQLTALGFSVWEDNAGDVLNGNCDNIYGSLDGTNAGEPLLLCAHMDTVEPSKGKQVVIDENGRITSGGDTVLGADDCAGIAAILEALRTIRDQQLAHRPVEVLFTVAEEPYCKGAEQFDFSKISAKQGYVLDLSGPVGAAAYQAPTILSFTVAMSGKSAHAGFAPEEGVHAIAATATAISKLNMGRVGGDTTVNIGTIQGGLAPNIVPDHCTISGEIRSFSHAKALEQADVVAGHFKAAAEAIGGTVDCQFRICLEAYKTPLDHPVVHRFEGVCKQLGLSGKLEQTFGGSDNNYLAKHGIAGIVLATAMNQCHSCEEYTTVEELQRIAELTLSLILAEH